MSVIHANNILSLKQLYLWGLTTLRAVGITNAGLEARILLAHVLNKSQEDLLLLLYQDLPFTSCVIEKFTDSIAQRSNFMPIAYITNHRECYGLPFYIDSSVLIPRADTEIIIECAVDYLNNHHRMTTSKLDDAVTTVKTKPIEICEIGVGSGCILLSVLMSVKATDILATGIDISSQAISVAQKNAQLLFNQKTPPQINWIVGDMFEVLEKRSRHKSHDVKEDFICTDGFDVIISNPPYIPTTQKHLMARETLLYEPQLALFASDNGYEFYHRIAKESKRFLKTDGVIMLEVGFDQAHKVTAIFTQHGFHLAQQRKDLSNIIRVLCFIL
ncbi:protein-(glutamine-N5) methyltransferase [Rickettsiales endosymbiont of Paramecium tredecaurelia]|uniref:peptide chain release factor N(5)-glutamine methyltransferase n=1 Tax=Candidatus Sarmatiella mevalonica TaxID=2770581 RepID=UPI001920A63E|nr:peptide chain release factor N(5)-glutamine methyltransferase [Candidatus Sarmatiella mevalonica]MBL3284964.1 protein-(glutamine-N5) methyltransferase [Candidatus Sarmatiella mevalonica]